jgi:hypothetical protein
MKTRHIFRLAFGFVLLATVISIASSAQSGNIKGVVKSPSGHIYISVWVVISQGGVEKGRSLTGDDGKYYSSNLNDGVYDIVVLKGTRQLWKEQVSLPRDSSHDILVRMTR